MPLWLAGMGFITGALVQVLPEPGGLTLILYDENLTHSVLVADGKTSASYTTHIGY